MFYVKGERVCAECGKTFSIRTWNQKYCCEECVKRSYKATRERGSIHTENKPKETLAEVSQKAREQGLTYGKYMAKRNFGGW